MPKKRTKKIQPDPNEFVTVQLTRRQIQIAHDALGLYTTYPSVLADTHDATTGDAAACLDLRQTLADAR